MDRETQLREWLLFVYAPGYSSPRPAQAARCLEEFPDLLGNDPHLACAVGNVDRVRQAIDSDSSWVNRPGGPLKMAPLVAAAFSTLVRLPVYTGRIRTTVQLLLAAGADPNSTWIDDDFPDYPLSALYGAAGKNHDIEITKALLDAGANSNDGESLYHSTEAKDLTCTRLLLEAGAKVPGTNALFRMLDFDNLAGLRLLLAHGADANEESLDRPIHHAIRRRRSLAHLDALLGAGADPAARTKDGVSAYILALRFGLTGVAERLRAAGAGEVVSDEERFVAACARADRADAEAILVRRPDIVSCLSEDELRQLPNLAQAGQSEAVKIMVELGWPVAVRGGDWKASALNFAVFRGDAELTRWLLQHGASWQEEHGYHDNAIGTLSFASLARPVEGGDWLGCAQALIDYGMPLPGSQYHFSETVEEFFRSRRQGA